MDDKQLLARLQQTQILATKVRTTAHNRTHTTTHTLHHRTRTTAHCTHCPVHTHPETDDDVSQDYSRWEWYTVTEILEGPLRNPTHLSTALQTKFIKRILSFLRPSNLLFSAQSWTVVRPPPLLSLRSFSLFSFALCWCLRRASLGG